MRTNKVKAKLKSGEAVYGCFMRHPSPSLVEVLGYQDWDFIVFDAEHGIIEPRDCEEMVRAAELRNVTPVVRVTTNQPPIILRFMDTGVQGVHVPWINSGPEAEAAVRSVKYHPRGIRGLAGVRAADYGQLWSFSQYIQQANQETLIVIHIETAEAVNHLPEIVRVDGLDVIFIGQVDLSHSLGLPGQLEHPTVRRAVQKIVDLVGETDLALGIMVNNASTARKWYKQGVQYITIGLETLVNSAARHYLSNLRT